MTQTTRIIFSQSRNRQGFSLVELLVAITIIIALAALVFTVTRKIRTNAQQATAMSALRQIGIANVAYSSEHNGAINVIRDANERGPYEGGGGTWVSNSFMGRMQPYLFAGLETSDQRILGAEINKSLSELFGTTDLKTMAGSIFSGVPVTTDGSGVRTPIAVNDRLRPKWGKDNPPFRVSSFGDPASVLYMTYGRYYFNPALAEKYLPLPVAGDNRRAIYFLPNRNGIFCVLDGHIEMLPPPIEERRFGKRPADP